MQIDVQSLEMAAAERKIEMSVLVRAIEEALLKAYLRLPGSVRGARAQLDLNANTVTIFAPETDEFGQRTGEEFDDTPSDFSRIATATVRSVITQRLREADDEKILGGFRSKVGELVNGTVEHIRDGQAIMVRLSDDLEAILPVQEQVPTEHLRPGQAIRALLIEATRGPRGPHLVISRSHPNLVRKLFELNCPEVAEGDVEIMSIAREAGHRSKISVRTKIKGVNPKAACIGEMGARVRAVVADLDGEKIDIVDWFEDPAQYVGSALSPAQVSAVAVADAQAMQIHVVVPDQQLSLAIGKEGQNARLAARLTGWKIDIHSDAENGTAAGSPSLDS